MKTTTQVLKEVYDKDEHRMADWPFHGQLDFILDAMKQFAEHVRDEDRKMISENAKVTKANNLEYGSEDEHWYMDEYGDSSIIIACKNSIINAPKQELK